MWKGETWFCPVYYAGNQVITHGNGHNFLIMTENVINFLKKLFLWTITVDHLTVYKKIPEYLPCDVRIINDSRVILDFGEFQDIKVSILLEFSWENNRLINIANAN